MPSLKHTRRGFFRTAAMLAPAIAAGAPVSRPNILLAIVDDWSWPFAALAGDKTQNTES